jgi:hypothetical protein
MELASMLRPVGLLAGPAAVLAFAAFVAGMLTVGEDALDGSLPAVASSGLLLVAVFGLGAVALAALVRLREAGAGGAGPATAVVGSVLVAGGTWTSVFAITALAADAPAALEQELAGLVIGFVASYAVFAIGWVWTGIALIRAGLVPTWLGVLVAVAGVLAFVPSPEPFRLLFIGVAATLLARRLAAAAPAPARVAQPA